jgi:lipoprotein NlpD
MKTDALLDAISGHSSRVFLLSICVALGISGCAAIPLGGIDTPSSATIDDRTSKSSDRRKSDSASSVPANKKASKTTDQTTAQTTGKTTQATNGDTDNGSSNTKKSQVSEALPTADADPPGYYTVKEGDTLLKISGKFNRGINELTEWNTLKNPDAIKAGQVLRVAPPDNEQVARIPVESDMEIRRAGRPTQSNGTSQTTVRAVSMNKTTPSGQKIVYSDKAIADLERGEPGPVRALDTIKTPTDSQPAGTGRFVWPTEGKVISGFDPTRKGIDIAGKAGQPVVAASNGKVLYAKNMRGYGNLIILEHSDSMVTAYAHNKTILVREGQMVTQRQQIAEMGDSDADTVKLRFQIRHMGKPVDPATLLPPIESQTPPTR